MAKPDISELRVRQSIRALHVAAPFLLSELRVRQSMRFTAATYRQCFSELRVRQSIVANAVDNAATHF